MLEMMKIDLMEGRDFEKFLNKIFSSMGYETILTPSRGDQGSDLVLIKNDIRIAVSAKRYDPKYSLGNDAIQEIIAGRIYYDCNKAWVITNSYFTYSAMKLADKADVKLFNRDDLVSLLTGLKLGYDLTEEIAMIEISERYSQLLDLHEFDEKKEVMTFEKCIDRIKYYICMNNDARTRQLRDYINANSSTMPKIYDRLIQEKWLERPTYTRNGYKITISEEDRLKYLQSLEKE